MTKAEKMAEEYSDLWDVDEVGPEWIPKKKIADLIHQVAERTREACAAEVQYAREEGETDHRSIKAWVLNAKWEEEEGE